ncbi:hypothetical protein V0R52_08910 [Pseudomonas asiatica]|uniref:hypothetical protein n=1 Tax=Pseudomonas asiatica TaxID=2219225 RepID=UPI002E7BCA72|nr:hypothetical protein [Pseudomonas asiatica]MEE1916511.1 hypothetical protein [Pseudomonas asiatica]
MVLSINKKRFLSYELGLLSLKAALSTRNSEAPVYARGTKTHQREEEKKILRAILDKLEHMYLDGNITEEQHVEFIERTAIDVSKALGNRLHNGRFRIGVAQKLINLHLKYLWATGHIQEPPHCPIDGIIRDKAKISYDWTTNDSIEAYKQAIDDLKAVAKTRTLAVWELEEFRRRGEM